MNQNYISRIIFYCNFKNLSWVNDAGTKTSNADFFVSDYFIGGIKADYNKSFFNLVSQQRNKYFSDIGGRGDFFI